METENISKRLNEEYDDKISDYSKRMKTHDAKEKNSTIALFIAACLSVATLPTNLSIGVVFTTIAAELACYKYKSIRKRDNINERYKKEFKHIRELELGAEKTNDNSSQKMNRLFQSRRKVEKKYEYATTITTLTYGLAIFGSVIAVINPAEIWIPIAGVISTFAAMNYEIKVHKDREILEKRINNLVVDLDIENIKENEKSIELENTKETKKDIDFEMFFETVKDLEETPKQYLKRKGGK